MSHRLAVVCGMLICGVVATACSGEAAKRRHFENGTHYLASGQVAEAIIELRGAVERDGRWGEARYKLAEAYAANDDHEHALREYVRAADLMPEDTAAQLQAATYQLRAGQYDQAEARSAHIVASDPRNIDARILLGNALARLCDLEAAISQVNDVMALEPGLSQAYGNPAVMKAAHRGLNEARAAFAKAIEADPKSVAARLALANLHWSLGDRKATEASLREATALDPAHVLANRALATFYVATGRAYEAEPHLAAVAVQVKTAAAALELADYYIQQSRDDDARRVLAAASVRPGAAALTETRLAGLAYRAGHTREAHKRVDDLLKRTSRRAEALVLKARWLFSEGQREDALAYAAAATAASPRLASAHYVRGLIESASHRSGDAIRSFSEVLRLNPRAVSAQVQLSRLSLARNAIEHAIQYAEEALVHAPSRMDARLALARAWAAGDDIGRAVAEVNRLEKQAPDVAAVHSLAGALHMIRGNHGAARSAYERALRVDAMWIEALTGLTALDVAEGNHASARVRIDEVMAGGHVSPEVLVLAGKVLLSAADWRQAEGFLRRAIDRDPINIEPYSLLGRLYARQNRLEAARAEFAAEALREPRRLAPRLMTAMIAHAQNDLDGAKAQYEEILRREPRAVLAANNLAAIYADARENLDRAQQLAESASDQLPAHPEVQDTLGWIYYQRHALGPAILRFEQSIAADPKNPVYHYHLGLAHSRNGEIGRARRALQTAIKLNPALADAQQALASLQE